MKEATGEGSMTVITILIIVGLAAAAAVIINIMVSNAKNQANNASKTVVDVCPSGFQYNATSKKCEKTS